MDVSRRSFLGGLAATGMVLAQEKRTKVTKYVRYRHEGRISYGVLEGDTIREIAGGLFGARKETGASLSLNSVKLLWPCEPPKILAVGLNYKSHIGERAAPKNPEIFYKPTSALLEPEGDIVIPRGAQNVHFEGELVAVIGRRSRDLSVSEAEAAVFGVTCGNDVSERDWQKSDLQWWRAKGSDSFAPLGPAIAVGLDYRKSRLQTRLNGEVKQSQYISDLLFDVPTAVSFISRHVTLLPGDVIYTGTPGATSAMKPGDIVEVEIDGVGILRNRVSGARS